MLKANGQIVIYAVVLFGLWTIPGVRLIITPLKLFAIGWHELSHAILVSPAFPPRHPFFLDFHFLTYNFVYIGRPHWRDDNTNIDRSRERWFHHCEGRSPSFDPLCWLCRFYNHGRFVHSRWLRHSRGQTPQLRPGRRSNSTVISSAG